jgi:hypothetical protein
MKLVATEAVRAKLWDKHEVGIEEAEEAWRNCDGPWLIDEREKNKTQPPTVWALAWTDLGRLLKIVVIPHKAKGIAVLRTAYEPDEEELELYESNI